MDKIDKNTYYKMPRWLMALFITSNKPSSKYKCSNKDLRAKNYVTIKVLDFNVKIPFKALFHSNSKIKGIKGLDFNNATFCDSYRLGYCRIGHKNQCYAFRFEYQYNQIGVCRSCSHSHAHFPNCDSVDSYYYDANNELTNVVSSGGGGK